ncbi:MAG: hypothetical protein ACFB4I_06445 [Cyanophyceae cyanobacterium]
MIKLIKSIKLYTTVFTGLLVGFLWLNWGQPAQAAQVSTPSATSERIEAFTSCLPKELTLNNKDVGDRISRALGEMTNDQVERAFNFTNSPAISDAEKEFESCLNRKGIVPARQSVQS